MTTRTLTAVAVAVLAVAGCTDNVRVQFKSCDEAREAGAPLPLTAADPGWNARLDPDHDGQAC